MSCLTGATWARVASRHSLATLWSVCIAWLQRVWPEYFPSPLAGDSQEYAVCLAFNQALAVKAMQIGEGVTKI